MVFMGVSLCAMKKKGRAGIVLFYSMPYTSSQVSKVNCLSKYGSLICCLGDAESPSESWHL